MLKSKFVDNNSKSQPEKGSSLKIKVPISFFCENTYCHRNVFFMCKFNFLIKKKSCPSRSLLTVKTEIWRDCFRREQTNQLFIQCHISEVFFFYGQYWIVICWLLLWLKPHKFLSSFYFIVVLFFLFFSILVPRACLTFKSSGIAWISVFQEKIWWERRW